MVKRFVEGAPRVRFATGQHRDLRLHPSQLAVPRALPCVDRETPAGFGRRGRLIEAAYRQMHLGNV